MLIHPQTRPLEPIRQGQEFWRLFGEVESSGDVFECEASGRTFALGAESDLANVRLSYFRQHEPDLIQEQVISAAKPLVGRLDAYASRAYRADQQGRIVMSLLDIVPRPEFRPPSAAPDDDVQIARPRLDLLVYFNQLPTPVPQRADRTFRFGHLDVLGEPNWFLVPFYGRRSAFVTAKSLALTNQPLLDVAVFGLNISHLTTAGGLADNRHQEVSLGRVNRIPQGRSARLRVADEAFDYLAVRVNGNDGAPFPDSQAVQTQILVSDRGASRGSFGVIDVG